MIVWLCWVYDAITNLAPLRRARRARPRPGHPGARAPLHLDPELTLDRWLAGHHSLALIVSDYYDNAHFVVTLGLLGWLWWRRADIYRPLRNTLVLVNVLAFLVFWRSRSRRRACCRASATSWPRRAPFGSWHTGALASHANQLAAMPSLHIAWAVWCTMVVWQLTRRVWARALAVVYPCLTSFAVLATGNHYVLDIAGGLVALALATAVAWLVARIASMRSERPAHGRVPTVTNLLRSR